MHGYSQMVPELDDAKDDGAERLELSADAEPSKVGCKMAPAGGVSIFCTRLRCSALSAPDEILGLSDIDREDIIAETFLALPPRIALSLLDLFQSAYRARPSGRGRGRIERTTGKICRY